MIKKLSMVLSITLAISFLGLLICLPLGINDTVQEFSTAFESDRILPRRITLDSVYTLHFNVEDGCGADILYRQAEGSDNIYIDIYTDDTFNETNLDITYPKSGEASVWVQRTFGIFSLDRKKIMRSILKEMQYYPDMIVYIPEHISVDTNVEELLYSSITFQQYHG
ncbi:hypothetical protein [Candidatus Soleaferrea massiliensis]|uniref:hypothetical protein n=1 Tax=Candidatus Soleaferrea massiliensis TaxID=1470354 RepID=UPI0005902776|nr:hypothetical protein [Candidatus Soleaferrea massiliensis]